ERNSGRPQVLGKLEPLHSARCGRNRKSLGLKVIRDQLARGSIVVDDENTVGSGRTAAVRTARAPRLRLRAAGQADGKDRALAGLACHRQVAAHHASKLWGDSKA